ncbi:MAG: hypothetical protein ACREQW_24850 [Candidatus Binatia bacterium]
MERLAKMKKAVMLAMLAVIMVSAVGCHWGNHRHRYRDRDYYDRYHDGHRGDYDYRRR